MENGGRGITPVMPHVSEDCFPNFPAIEVIAEHARRSVPDEHTRTVRGWSGRAVRIGAMRWLNRRILDRADPESLAISSVEAVKISFPALILRASDKDAPARSDGTTV